MCQCVYAGAGRMSIGATQTAAQGHTGGLSALPSRSLLAGPYGPSMRTRAHHTHAGMREYINTRASVLRHTLKLKLTVLTLQQGKGLAI